MNQKEVIKKTVAFVKKEFESKSCGHDWWHIYRVWKLAQNIAKQEKNVDSFIIDLTALLHDVGDPKFHNRDLTAADRIVGAWLDKMEVESSDKKKILYIINNMSFSKSLMGNKVKKSKEFMVVQDADRIDAIGAVGIARLFAFGGKHGRIIHDPNFKIKGKLSEKEYNTINRPGTHHFYEKLFFLKDMMNTKTGKKIALKRHKFMKIFLKEFYEEWDGKD